MGQVRQPLSRERVLEAARDLVDAEGLGALTMRRLAADLEVEAMSLYHHIPGKEPLLDGLVEKVLSDITSAAAATTTVGADWRAVLRARFLAARVVMIRHPWAPALLASRPAIPPALFVYYDAILATLAESGFSYSLAHKALHSFGSMALGFTQELFTPASAGGPTDVSDAELTAMAASLPHLQAMVAAELHAADGDPLGWCDSQAEFEFTLDLILDGLDRIHRESR